MPYLFVGFGYLAMQNDINARQIGWYSELNCA